MDACSVNTIVCPQCHAALDVRAEVCHQCGAATFGVTTAGTGTQHLGEAKKKGCDLSMTKALTRNAKSRPFWTRLRHT